MKDTKPPKRTISNVLHESTNKFLQAKIGPVGFLIDFILPSFHQKELEKWRENVHLELKRLGEYQESFNLENLLNNQEFSVILIHAVQAANRSFQEEKLNIIKNGIINSVESTFSSDLKLSFVKLIDELSVTHFKLLNFLDKNSNEIFNISGYSELLTMYEKETKESLVPHEFKMFLMGLESNGLIRISQDFSGFENEVYQQGKFAISTGKERNLSYVLILDTGKNLLEFIRDGNDTDF